MVVGGSFDVEAEMQIRPGEERLLALEFLLGMFVAERCSETILEKALREGFLDEREH